LTAIVSDRDGVGSLAVAYRPASACLFSGNAHIGSLH
jgi:hypothetical protein